MPQVKSTKQERFCIFIASGMPEPDAFVSAGFTTANRNYARTLLKDPLIIERIQELRLQPQLGVNPLIEEIHTKAKVIAELLVLGNLAKQAKSWSAAIRAQELLGKELGMFSDKSDGFEWDGDINKLSKGQRVKLRVSMENMVRESNGRRQIIEGSAVRSEGEGVRGEAEGIERAPAEPQGIVEVGAAEARPGPGGGQGAADVHGGVDTGDDPAEIGYGGTGNPFKGSE